MKKLLFFLFAGLCLSSQAQNTNYFLEHLPQSNLMNPALIPDVSSYVSLPGIGGISTQAYNSGFNYNEISDFIDQVDEGYVDENFINNIGGENRFEFQSSVNLLAFGFKLKEKAYFSFNLTSKTFSQINTPSEVARLIAYYATENYEGFDFPLSVSNSKLLLNSYVSASFTYARKIGEHLTIGISPTINFNLIGVKATNLKYIVEAEYVDGELETNETFEGEALVGLPSEINPDAIDGDVLDLDEDPWDMDVKTSEALKNKSFSINFGMNYELDKWNFSASVLNLGKNTWKTNGYKLNGNNDEVKIQDEKVKIKIPTQVILGVNRGLSERWNVGLMTNSVLYPDKNQHAVTASLNGYIGRMLSASVSYTAGFETANLGAGARIRFFPGLDLFVVTDNVVQLFNYKESNRVTASVGMNLSFGNAKQHKASVD